MELSDREYEALVARLRELERRVEQMPTQQSVDEIRKAGEKTSDRLVQLMLAIFLIIVTYFVSNLLTASRAPLPAPPSAGAWLLAELAHLIGF